MVMDYIMFLQQVKSKYRHKRYSPGISYSYILCLYILTSFVCVCDASEDCVGSDCTKKETDGGGVGAHLSYSSGLLGDARKPSDTPAQNSELIVHTCKGGRSKLTALQGYITDGTGNYTLNVRCTWLIESGQRGLPIKLSFEHLATECAWDHFYVYDGDSAFSPKVAAFSGLIMKPGYERYRPEVITHSGSAYLYFYSDAAFVMSGFNITYTINSSCSDNCTLHGQCVNSLCRCEPLWTGSDCMTPVCPDGCSTGQCDVNKRRCSCPRDRHGSDCNTPVGQSAWTRVHHQTDVIGRSSHSSLAHEEYIYMFGGYSWAEEGTELPVLRFSTKTEKLEQLSISGVGPTVRYAHTTVHYKDRVYLYGGSTSQLAALNQLWTFDLTDQRWELATNQGSLPIAVSGHTAHAIGGSMYVMFGYSPSYGYLSFVQKYDFDQGTWSIVRSGGATVSGAYGAASVYDEMTETIYLHAGYRLTKTGDKNDDLYSFHLPSQTWRVLRSTGQVRHLHSAVIVDGLMLVFGGNTDNDVNVSSGAKCYSNGLIAYDTVCDRWLTLQQPTELGYAARFGHTATLHDRTMYVFGGFNGRLLSDLLTYEPGRCSAHAFESECLSANQGAICVWTNGRCQLLSVRATNGSDVTYPICPSRGGGKMFGELSMECERQRTCASCLASSALCNWCNAGCKHDACPTHTVATTNGSCRTLVLRREECSTQVTCSSCHVLTTCMWNLEKNICQYTGGDRKVFMEKYNVTVPCPAVCSTYNTCMSCTSKDCMWCASESKCAESDAYLATFPYGQCLDWSTISFKCPASECPSIKECSACHSQPECGWCDDGTNTGAGSCMYGGNAGPIRRGNATLALEQCAAEQWYFTDCPRCQCNGHSRCHENSVKCVECEGNTGGDECQYCAKGYWGTALNGGTCSACDCNEHAETCDQLTGKCQCQTKGIVGDKCDKCDSSRQYHGNPDTGTCYYIVATDYEIRFNLSSLDEGHVNKANFLNTPPSHDRDLDFSINCSRHALFNVTVKTVDSNEFPLITNQPCLDYNERFSHSRYSFGTKKNTTIYVYLFDFQTPFQVTITFTQFLKIDLFNFFITFFGCFLSLLLVAALFWKVKQRYEIYTRRQRALIEMEKMIKRPFATVLVKIGDNSGPLRFRHGAGKLQCPPASAVSIEPVRDSRLAVISVLLEMPLGGGYYPPANQSGLAVASTLASIGHMKSNDKPSDLHKRKHAQGPAIDACI